MAEKPIQTQFGERVIEAFADFARADMKTVDELRKDEFSHVTDTILRQQLAEVFYGVRWIYKLGLATLARDVERAAHIRAQIVDYASVVEALLGHVIVHAIHKSHEKGAAWQWKDPDKMKQPIAWDRKNASTQLRKLKLPLWWRVRVAREFGIVSLRLETELEWLRNARNRVHIGGLTSLKHQAFLNQSERAFKATLRTISETKNWRTTHP